MLRWIWILLSVSLLYAQERYEPLYEKLRKKGMSKDEIGRIFASQKAEIVDAKTLEMMAPLSKIPHLRERERAATERLLGEIHYLTRHLTRYQATYELAEARYGVNREIIAALLQKETALGTFTRFKHDAFVVYNTILGHLSMPENPTERERRRTERLWRGAEQNLAALILYYHKRGIDVTQTDIPSSYAGAMGIPQFTPWLLEEAVSADGGMADLMKMEDAILSVAHLLRHRLKWPNELIDFKKLESLEELNKAWVTFDSGSANIVYGRNLEGMPIPNFSQEHKDDGTITYLVPYLKSLMGYNYSSDYALGIVRIARASWLKSERR